LINLNLDWEILTCILLWRQNQEILVSIEISQLSRPTFCNCWDFLGCRDLLLPSVEIETLDQDHVKTNWDPQAYIGYSMTTLKSANITSVSYRPRVHSKILATKYPRHKQTYCDKVPVSKTFFQRVDYKIRVAIIGPKLKKLNSVESTKKELCRMEIQTFQVSFLKSWAI